LRKYYWTVLTEVIWLKLGTVEGLCKHDDWNSGSIKGRHMPDYLSVLLASAEWLAPCVSYTQSPLFVVLNTARTLRITSPDLLTEIMLMMFSLWISSLFRYFCLLLCTLMLQLSKAFPLLQRLFFEIMVTFNLYRLGEPY
jgi:hypothetical protein